MWRWMLNPPHPLQPRADPVARHGVERVRRARHRRDPWEGEDVCDEQRRRKHRV